MERGAGRDDNSSLVFYERGDGLLDNNQRWLDSSYRNRAGRVRA